MLFRSEFNVDPVLRGAPAALWDHRGADAAAPTVRTVGGFRLSPGPRRAPLNTARLQLDQLSAEWLDDAGSGGPGLVAQLDLLGSRKVSDPRDLVLGGLGLDPGSVARRRPHAGALRLDTLAVGDR